MPLKNRIQELRDLRRLTQDQLAEIVGEIDSSRVNKIEKAKNVKIENMERFARALGVDPIEIIDDRPRGPSPLPTEPEAEPYTPDKDDPLLRLITPGHSLWRALTNSLSDLRIMAGDRLLVRDAGTDGGPFQMGDTVIAIYTNSSRRSIPLLRQFIEPHLLITNSAHENAVPLNMRTHTATISGRVLHHIGPARR